MLKTDTKEKEDFSLKIKFTSSLSSRHLINFQDSFLYFINLNTTLFTRTNIRALTALHLTYYVL